MEICEEVSLGPAVSSSWIAFIFLRKARAPLEWELDVRCLSGLTGGVEVGEVGSYIEM